MIGQQPGARLRQPSPAWHPVGLGGGDGADRRAAPRGRSATRSSPSAGGARLARPSASEAGDGKEAWFHRRHSISVRGNARVRRWRRRLNSASSSDRRRAPTTRRRRARLCTSVNPAPASSVGRMLAPAAVMADEHAAGGPAAARPMRRAISPSGIDIEPSMRQSSTLPGLARRRRRAERRARRRRASERVRRRTSCGIKTRNAPGTAALIRGGSRSRTGVRSVERPGSHPAHEPRLHRRRFADHGEHAAAGVQLSRRTRRAARASIR